MLLEMVLGPFWVWLGVGERPHHNDDLWSQLYLSRVRSPYPPNTKATTSLSKDFIINRFRQQGQKAMTPPFFVGNFWLTLKVCPLNANNCAIFILFR